jgi:hypothetical protein
VFVGTRVPLQNLIDYLAANLGRLGLPDQDFEAMKAAA